MIKCTTVLLAAVIAGLRKKQNCRSVCPLRLLPVLLCFGHLGQAANPGDPGPGQFIATLPERYKLTRLPGAWPGLYQLLRDIHQDLGTPLVSNGLFYVGPLLDAIDKQAAIGNAVAVTREVKNLTTLGPDGGFVYAWVFRLPASSELSTDDVHVCYEAVGAIRGTGLITPMGEFIRTELPRDRRTCAEFVERGFR